MRATQLPTGPAQWRNAGTVGGVRPTGARLDGTGRPSAGRIMPPRTPPVYAADPVQGYNILPWPIASFETALAGVWQATGATLAPAGGAFDGQFACAATTTTTGDATVATAGAYNVWAGLVYYTQFAASTTAAGVTAAIEVDFYDIAGTLLAANIGPYAPVVAGAGTWTKIAGPVGGWQAPPTAVAARVVVHVNAGASGVQVLLDAVYAGVAQNAPVFTSNTYISFDPPSTPYPTWTDITPYVQIDESQISITRGRQDGLNDVNTSTLTAVLDNADGRFFEGNPNSPYFGQLHKGNWIKQTLTAFGQTSTRFVGFATWPNATLGGAQTAAVNASDWFGKLGQFAALNSAYYEELTNDPTGAVVFGFWPLNESAGTKGTAAAPQVMTASDISGYTGSNLATSLVPRNVAAGGTVSWAQASAPGFDGDQAITFQPVSASQGTVLRGNLSRPVGNNWALEFWFQVASGAVAANEVTMLTLADYTAGHALELVVSVTRAADGDPVDGFLKLSLLPTSPASPNTGNDANFYPNLAKANYIADGTWHHLALVAVPDFNFLNHAVYVWLDGRFITDVAFGGFANATILSTLQTITVGGRDDILNHPVAQIGDPPGPANCFNGSIYGLSVSDTTNCPLYQPLTDVACPTPSVTAHYQACATGWSGETVSARLTRLARYTGVPAAWCNFDSSISTVGPQQLLGRYPLDVMREAARTEAMPLYCAPDGRITLKNRTVRMNGSPAWTIQSAELDPQTQQVNDFSYLINEVDVSRALAGTIKVIGPNGAASQAKYGLYYTSQNTANISDVDAMTFGQWIIAGTSNPLPRLAPIAFEAATLAQASSPLWASAGYGYGFYTAVLASDTSTFCAVAGLPATMGGGSQMSVIEGSTETIAHAIHSFQFHTTPATGVPVFTSVFQLDMPPFNQLDAQNVLAY